MAAAKPAAKAGTAVARAKINLPVDINALMAAEIANIKNRVGVPSGGDRITVTQAKTFKLADGAEVEEIEASVVEFVAANYYYTESFDRGNIVPPACFSISDEPATMVPSINSPDPQSGSCASCWANQFGSSGKGKACQNTRLLALLPTDADVDTPVAIIKISPTAIRAFDGHVSAVARKRSLPVRAIVTKLSFSDDQYSSVRFTDLGPANKELVALSYSQLEDAKERLNVEPNIAAVESAGNKSPKPAARGKPPAKAPQRSANVGR